MGTTLLLLAALLSPDAARLVRDLAALRFDRLGDPVVAWDAIPPVAAPRERPHELLVVLVEFADRGFDRFKGDADQGKRLAAWYQGQLFDPTESRRGTLSHYYAAQSRGAYHLQGRVLPPVRLAKARAAYGAPARPPGGAWRNDGAPEALVEDALALARQRTDVDWAAFDRWDPGDFDGDGVRDEPDGYLDHLVLIYAGGGQAACEGLYKLDEKLAPDAGPEALDRLTPEERECADRIWPHRFVLQRREGEGPRPGNARGGLPIAANLWARDYDMQSEYTDVSTFIHELGHSLGLPDLYARTSSNGTGGWDAMATTADPVPQNLSAWSRTMLGWLKPRVVLPPEAGGAKAQSFWLQRLDGLDAPGTERAALVVLPPGEREIELAPPRSGRRALYSGQGNDLDRRATLTLDLRGSKGAVELSFDAWWDIEAGWDFAYVETSTDGRTWTRRRPTDARLMPAEHGHDGPDTRPGFTGRSGDLDGDGRDESAPGCDPRRAAARGEDEAGRGRDPCAEPAWVRPRFDLSDLAGHEARVRWRYFTDMAAVMRGLLIDDVRVTGVPKTGTYRQDFEETPGPEWRLDGFVPSPGRHTVLVPRYYVVEYRDPYAPDSYDRALAEPYYRFYRDPGADVMRAVEARPRPGVLVWYANGAYAWSENDPAEHGQGQGFLLPVDAHPDEIRLPGLERWYRGAPGDTRYEVDGPEAQAALAKAFAATACFVRNGAWRPREPGVRAEVERACAGPDAPISRLRPDGRPLIYSFELLNDLLPGEARAAWRQAGELYDYEGGAPVTWRLRDRALRGLHTLDAPFAPDPFPDGLVFYEADAKGLRRAGSAPWPAAPRFDDRARWLDPHLYFGGADVPPEGLSIEVSRPGPAAPAGAAVEVRFAWDR